MTSGTVAEFREAARHEHELNERQREILALIAKGHTNREIAEMLRMSLDGAKWNVSEILSKLGLASREEAAEYWRWRHEGVWHGAWAKLRALVAVPAIRIAGAGGTAAFGIAVVAFAMLRDEPREKPVPGSFYVEATLQIHPDVGLKREIFVRFWQRDAMHWRQEIEDRTPDLHAGTRIVVWDGEQQWEWDSRLNTTTRARLDESIPWSEVLSGPPYYWPLAPARLQGESIDDYVARVSVSRGDLTVVVRRVGTEQVLGREAVILETTTTVSSRTPSTSRMWVEPEHLYVLGLETGPPLGTPLEVRRVEHEPYLEDELFELKAPPGSRVEESDDTPLGSLFQDVSPPAPQSGNNVYALQMLPPFLSIGSVPRRYVAWGETSELGADGAVVALDTMFGTEKVNGLLQEAYRGRYLRVEQSRRVDGLPAALQVGERVDIRGNEGFIVEGEEESSVAWAADGVAVRVSSDELSGPELVEFAREMYWRGN